MAIEFEVPGAPVPQPRPRFTRQGGFPRAYTKRGHPVIPFRQAVAMAARMAGAKPHGLAVTVEVEAVFQRPPSHRRLKSPPELPLPDVDNLAKAVLDALKGIAWNDDKQVGRLVVEKRYGDTGRTIVRIA